MYLLLESSAFKGKIATFVLVPVNASPGVAAGVSVLVLAQAASININAANTAKVILLVIIPPYRILNFSQNRVGRVSVKRKALLTDNQEFTVRSRCGLPSMLSK
jgi:hypothetical protein